MTTTRIETLIDAALPNVTFDGWSQASFDAAIKQTGIAPATAKILCPRGAIDLAVAYHKRGDAAMMRAMAQADLTAMRYSEKVAHAIRLRLASAGDKEVVRRGTTLFSLPIMPPKGPSLSGAQQMRSGLRWATHPMMRTGIANGRLYRRSTAPLSCSGWATPRVRRMILSAAGSKM